MIVAGVRMKIKRIIVKVDSLSASVNNKIFVLGLLGHVRIIY